MANGHCFRLFFICGKKSKIGGKKESATETRQQRLYSDTMSE